MTTSENSSKKQRAKERQLFRPPNPNHDVTMNEADQDKVALAKESKKNIQTAAEKRSEYKKQWYLKNRQRVLNQRRDAYRLGRGASKEYSKSYAEKNKKKIADYKSEYATKNREELLRKKKEHYIKNREAILAKCKEYESQNRPAVLKRSRAWREKNKDHVTQWSKQYREGNKGKRRDRYQNDVNHRTASLIRSRLLGAIRAQKCRKTNKTLDLLGCEIGDFKNYLQSLFTKGMTWANQGSFWHIDHIIPLSSFDLSSESQLRQACHWSNMRPLKAKDNLEKSDKMTEPQMHLLLPAI